MSPIYDDFKHSLIRMVLDSFQTVDLSTLTFPNEMHIDYVRVYQRDGQTNIGCSPPDYPTADYIANHPVAYSSM